MIRTAIVALLLASLSAVAVELPPDASVRGELKEQGGRLVAEGNAVVSLPLTADTDTVVVRAVAGTHPTGVGVTFKTGAAALPEISFKPRDLKLRTGQVWADAYLEMPRGGRLFVRPNAEFYTEPRLRELAKTWESTPGASRHVVTLELRRPTNAVEAQVWVDGRFVNELPLKSPLTSCEVRLPAGAELAELNVLKKADESATPTPAGSDPTNRRLGLALEHFARPGVMADAHVTLPDGANAGIKPAPGAASIEVAGLGRLSSPSDDLVSLAWQRGALDSLPETRVFSVPLDTYSHAHVLCAADDLDPAKAPAFTLRVTRYANSRGDALADTLVTLPATDTADAKRVGSVAYGPKDARKTAPLWLIGVPLKNGLIQDLLTDDKRKSNSMGTHRYLDVELLDPLEGIEENDAFPPTLKPTGRSYVPRGAKSSVHVFGLSLERSPATMTVRASTPVNMFYASDKPEWRAAVDAGEDGVYTMSWEFADVDGKIAASGKAAVRREPLPASGQPGQQPGSTIAVPVSVPVGWYATRFRLFDQTGRELVDYRGSFVMLPPDTRKAGFESPHGSWWFHWAHGGEPNIERVGPLLERAGLRHTILPKTLPESVTSKYKVTAWNVNWFNSRSVDFDQRLKEHEAFIRSELALWPSLGRVLIWHESGAGGAAFPSELWGVTPPPANEKTEAAWQVRMTYVTKLAKMIREKFPKLKMQWGNDGSSLGIIAELLRRKMPREYIDSIAVEDLGQTIIPEKAIPGGMQSAWFLRETTRKLGYPDVPVTAAYEWMGRRDMVLGTGTQAEWYVRDALHGRAYGFAQLAIGTVHDAGAGYFHSLWGAGGLCRRYPTMDPKPSYMAMATHTCVMDGARFERAAPTGSLSLYAAEFKRGEDWVYAIWTPRGQREMTMAFTDVGERTVTGLYGRERVLGGAKLELTASTAAQYVVSKTRVERIVAGRSSFPDDVPPAKPFVVDAMDSLDGWTVQAEKDKRLERVTGEYMPHRTMGKFDVRAVEDDEKGKCLEVELKPEGQVWDVMHEYVVLKVAKPVSGPGPFTHAGVWLKGNSGWGEVMWELEDAKGGKFLSQGVYMDWPGTISANFDGWNFLRLPLQADPKWRSDVRVTGLVVTVPRKTLYLTEMAAVKELKVRLKGLCFF